MSAACQSPLDLERLSAYRQGELDPADEQTVEEHYFACDECSRRLAWLDALAEALGEAVRTGSVSTNVSSRWLSHAVASGIRVRSYELTPGAGVQCTVGPEDDFVVVRLRLDENHQGPVDLETQWTDLTTAASQRRDLLQLFVDPEAHEVVYAFSAALVRTFPRSRWVMHVRPAGGDAAYGPYTMNHTPWAELDHATDPAL